MPRIAQSEATRRDLIEHFVYLAENAGLDVADHFLAQAEVTFENLVRQPMIGTPLHLKHAALAQVRKWSVREFNNHLVFYVPYPHADWSGAAQSRGVCPQEDRPADGVTGGAIRCRVPLGVLSHLPRPIN